jgi:hypothetical protein
MANWYEYSEIKQIRARVSEQLKLYPRSGTSDQEAATQFWGRVEREGKLCEALALFDELLAARMEYMHLPRETKQQFAARIEREGRHAEVERIRAELREIGLTEREVQKELVEQLQPLDGTVTRPWETPDPWQAGRLFRKKADQDRLVGFATMVSDRYEDEDEDDFAERKHAEEELERLRCARLRQEERRALAAARRRAHEISAANSDSAPEATRNSTTRATSTPAPGSVGAPTPAETSAEARVECGICHGHSGTHYDHCRRFVSGQTPLPCKRCMQGIVMPSNPTYEWIIANHCDACYARLRPTPERKRGSVASSR